MKMMLKKIFVLMIAKMFKPRDIFFANTCVIEKIAIKNSI